MKGGNGANAVSAVTHSPLGEEFSRKVREVRKVINWRGACGGSLQRKKLGTAGNFLGIIWELLGIV
ncbi:MAG: hypothetical protein IJQ39_10210 [Thermoguttaceae bacterium]|nr:hypothetical protein [Thermoguttaceae bacterium]